MIDIEGRELETGWRDFLQEMTGGRRCIRAAGVSGCVYGNRNPKVCSRGRKGPDLGHSLSAPLSAPYQKRDKKEMLPGAQVRILSLSLYQSVTPCK